MTIDQVVAFVDPALGIVPDKRLDASMETYQNAMTANSLYPTLLAQEAINLIILRPSKY
jgi:hypothetical protein